LEQESAVSFVTVGKKARDFIVRTQQTLLAEFTMPNYPNLLDTQTATQMVIEEYNAGRVDRVFMLWPRFINTAVQTPTVRQILPIEASDISDVTEHDIDYIYEPSAEAVL